MWQLNFKIFCIKNSINTKSKLPLAIIRLEVIFAFSEKNKGKEAIIEKIYAKLLYINFIGIRVINL